MSVTYYDLFGPARAPDVPTKPLIEWGNYLSVNHQVIDEQHKAIFDIGATVYENWRNGMGNDVLQPAVAELAKLLEEHFSYEEELLRSLGYDEVDEHAVEHRNMLDQVKNIQERLSLPDPDGQTPSNAATWPIIKLILGFTIAHVMTSDMSYSKELFR